MPPAALRRQFPMTLLDFRNARAKAAFPPAAVMAACKPSGAVDGDMAPWCITHAPKASPIHAPTGGRDRCTLPTMEQLILAQSDHMRAVGSRLRMIIDALGLPYVDAAAELGVSKSHLGNWMRGDSYPRQYELYRFCRIRGINTDYIFLGDPSGLPGRVLEALIRQEQEQAATAEPDHPPAGTNAP